MKSSLRVGAVLVLVASGLASADTIALKNGRRIEGHILSQTPAAVTIEVPGGQMNLPRSQIVSIEEGLSIEDQYARRAVATDMGDPDALEALAAWARRHQLEPRARLLDEHAKGVRLEERFARAKTASELLDLAAWAKSQGFATDVRRLAVARALRQEPENATARAELARIIEEDRKTFEADRLRELAEREKAVAEREKQVTLKEKALREKAHAERAERPKLEADGAGPDHLGARRQRSDEEDPAKAQTPPTQQPPQPPGYIIFRRRVRPKPTFNPLLPLNDDGCQTTTTVCPQPQPRQAQPTTTNMTRVPAK